MFNINWLHLQFNILLLLVIGLTTVLVGFYTKEFSNVKFQFIRKFKPTTYLVDVEAKANTSPQNECLECDTPRFNYHQASSTVSRKDNIREFPFKTVEEAWSRDNLNVAQFIKPQENTMLLEPNFQVR